MDIKGKPIYYLLKDYKLWLLGQYERVLHIVDEHSINDDDIDCIRIDAEMLKAISDKIQTIYNGEAGSNEFCGF